MRLEIRRGEDGAWNLDGNPIAFLGEPDNLTDLDLGFTPATNLVPIRRLALEVGDASDAPAAWLDAKTGRVELLAQRYERRTESALGRRGRDHERGACRRWPSSSAVPMS